MVAGRAGGRRRRRLKRDLEGVVKGPGGKGASGTERRGRRTGRRDGGRDRSRELTSPSANFITELVVFAQIISIYSTQAGNLFASECMREWNLPRSQHRSPMCGSPSLSSRYPCVLRR